MSTSKNEAFHRLAGKRVESIIDALRIFSNLAGPSYDFSPDEVMTYFGGIDEARNVALSRFQETKAWRQTDLPIVAEAEETVSADSSASTPLGDHRAQTLSREVARLEQIIKELRRSPIEEGLAATIALQREVIERLQSDLDQRRAA